VAAYPRDLEQILRTLLGRVGAASSRLHWLCLPRSTEEMEVEMEVGWRALMRAWLHDPSARVGFVDSEEEMKFAGPEVSN